MRTRRTGKGVARTASLGAIALGAMTFASIALASPDGPTIDPGQRILAAASPEAAALVARADLLVHEAQSDAQSEAQSGAQNDAQVDMASQPEDRLGDRLKQAWALYARAWTLAPRSALPPRGICQLAILICQLGKRTPQQQSAAEAACQNALVLGGTPDDMRNRVTAWVMGPRPPTMDELVAAFSMTDGAVRVAPAQPWGYLARADLALRLRDRDLLDAARSELRRVSRAPEELARMLSLTRTPASWRVTTGRLMVLLGLLVTLAHAAARRRRRQRQSTLPTLVISAAVVLGLLFCGPTSLAAPATSAPAPEQALDNPLGFSQHLLELTAEAQAATARGDHASAVRVYRELTRLVPHTAYAYARLCDALEDSGQREEAITACRTALTRPGIKEGDFAHFVRLLLSRATPLGDAERRQIDLVIDQLALDPRAALAAARLRCNLATHERDLTALGACTATLVAAEPAAPATVSFEWALAFERRDVFAAERLLRRARAAGVDQESLARMQSATRALTRQRLARAGVWAAGGLVVSLVLLASHAAARRRLSRWRRPGPADDTRVQRNPLRS